MICFVCLDFLIEWTYYEAYGWYLVPRALVYSCLQQPVEDEDAVADLERPVHCILVCEMRARKRVRVGDHIDHCGCGL